MRARGTTVIRATNNFALLRLSFVIITVRSTVSLYLRVPLAFDRMALALPADFPCRFVRRVSAQLEWKTKKSQAAVSRARSRTDPRSR